MVNDLLSNLKGLSKMRDFVKRIPILRSAAEAVFRNCLCPPKPFPGSRNYWVERYSSGGSSGDGSYGKLAKFKAEFINTFIQENSIRTIIEYGCGDGNQLKLAKYQHYTGFDVSSVAINMCKDIFCHDTKKTFKLMDNYSDETAELTLSLDVIYHLIEDDVFISYMDRLFDSSERFVIIYASNTDINPSWQAAHVKHRKFTNWVHDMKSGWRLVKRVLNRYPFTGDTKAGSFSDFFIFARSSVKDVQ